MYEFLQDWAPLALALVIGYLLGAAIHTQPTEIHYHFNQKGEFPLQLPEPARQEGQHEC